MESVSGIDDRRESDLLFGCTGTPTRNGTVCMGAIPFRVILWDPGVSLFQPLWKLTPVGSTRSPKLRRVHLDLSGNQVTANDIFFMPWFAVVCDQCIPNWLRCWCRSQRPGGCNGSGNDLSESVSYRPEIRRPKLPILLITLLLKKMGSLCCLSRRTPTPINWVWHLELRRGWNRTGMCVCDTFNPAAKHLQIWMSNNEVGDKGISNMVHHLSASLSLNQESLYYKISVQKCLVWIMFTWMLPKDRTLFGYNQQGPISLHWGVRSNLFGWISISWSWTQHPLIVLIFVNTQHPPHPVLEQMIFEFEMVDFLHFAHSAGGFHPHTDSV